ncbi:MAG: DUF4124 domain-containing protein [Burkholderiales bacterium]|nr:DUF4124 domain-containing protein [Burkholderiales bacterium]
MKTIWKTLAGIALLSFAASAFAQYIWLDEKGVKQYSDQPPPSSIPKNRILKEGGRINYSAVATSSTDEKSTSASASASASAPKTTAERNADFNKRKMEQEKKEKEEAEKSRKTAEKQKNCERARAYNRALASGGRITQPGTNGERSFMSDDQRARELQETQQTLNDCN